MILETYPIARISAARSHECASVHAASFDTAWDTVDFDRFFGAGATIAHGAIDVSNDKLVAFVLSRVAADEAEILTLAVAPANRRKGLARRLLEAHLECLAGLAVVSLFLEVDTGNRPARALYARLGFATVGERKAYYRSAGAPPSAALVMRRDLVQNRTVAVSLHDEAGR